MIATDKPEEHCQEPSISVEGLAKAYRIGLADEVHDTFAATIASWIKAPAKNLRNLRRVADLRKDQDADDVVWALREVNMEIMPGEVVGIIGRNGAGKSTLLKVLSGITKPTEGTATIRGRVGSLLEVGTGFHPDLTGRENVYLNGTILGMSKSEIDEKFDEIIAFSEVERFIDTPIKRYSSGMSVRLAFSVAAHLEPEILLIDEVLAVGDASFQRKCLGRMGAVASEGRTVLFVSHNVATIEALCERVVVIDQGKVVYDGETQGGIQRYLEDSTTFSCDVDLREHSGRYEKLSPTMRNLKVSDAQGELSHSFRLDEDIVFEVEVDAGEDIYPEGVLFISLFSNLGQSVVILRSDIQSTIETRIDGPTRFRCVLNRVRLVPGDYTVTLALSDVHTWIDRIDQVTTIEVRPTDVYGTGMAGKMRGGVWVPDVSWSIERV